AIADPELRAEVRDLYELGCDADPLAYEAEGKLRRRLYPFVFAFKQWRACRSARKDRTATALENEAGEAGSNGGCFSKTDLSAAAHSKARSFCTDAKSHTANHAMANDIEAPELQLMGAAQ
ncbi:MAG: hypothetical protein UCH28_02290, partial [Adlercreutzia sp.]|nr:hypothetical protein [Adlercreutzia sp.]